MVHFGIRKPTEADLYSVNPNFLKKLLLTWKQEHSAVRKLDLKKNLNSCNGEFSPGTFPVEAHSVSSKRVM